MLHALLLLGLLHTALPAGVPQAQVISLSLGLLPEAGSDAALPSAARETSPEVTPAMEFAVPEVDLTTVSAPGTPEVGTEHADPGSLITLSDAMGAATADYIGQLRLYLDMTKRQPASVEPRPKGGITYFILLDRAGSVRDYG
ncbi:hypothetical protein, partial [Chitinimonas sp. JJ19]|uniref:hypothetical protein n=1 Tax=Chitinimonas sp. JJ19 TaxID=3109352 RepID=UPI002FFD702D